MLANTIFRLSLYAVIVLGAAGARGDFLDSYVDFQCDASQNRAEIAPYGVSNKEVGSVVLPFPDCEFVNGRIVRVRRHSKAHEAGSDRVYVDQRYSVWVDNIKVVDRMFFACDREGRCDQRVIVSAGDVKICTGGNDSNRAASRDRRTGSAGEVCQTIPNSELVLRQRDRLEYPLPGDPVPPDAGDLVTLYARDQEFCGVFGWFAQPGKHYGYEGWDVNLPEHSERINRIETTKYSFFELFSHLQFDINNDGKEDTVIAMQSESRYRDGDVLFVFRKPTPAVSGGEVVWLPAGERAFAQFADRIYPHYWVDPPASAETEYRSTDRDSASFRFKSAGAPWWDATDVPEFRLRYWRLWPFRYKGATYFLNHSQEPDKAHWWVVLRPEPDDSVTEMCLLHRARRR